MVKTNKKYENFEISKKELKSIMITILICFFHAIGKGPSSLTPIFYLTDLDEVTYNTFLLNTNMITWLCQSMTIFVYILFNQEFRNRFKILFLNKIVTNKVSNNDSRN